ncbi:MAG: DNA polymerase III subunit alpha [Candidatus Nanopelagicales bacterium]
MPEFSHLHVASGSSLRYGTAHPQQLVTRAAELGQQALALTDRDGLYAAVQFAQSCQEAGIRPVLGVDLAVPSLLPGVPGEQTGRGRPNRTPARGGVAVDPGHPRVVLLAAPDVAGGVRGWGALCRAVSGAQLSGERGSAVATLGGLAQQAEGLRVLLGPGSDVGRALARRRPDLAAAVVRAWQEAFGERVVIEVVSHRASERTARGTGPVLSTTLAARMLGFARELGLPVVLSNAVRYLEPAQAPLADVLDAVRRLVPLDARHLERCNAQGYLKSAREMAAVAAEVVRASGVGPERGEVARLLAATSELAAASALEPGADMGIGSIHVPELDVLFPQGVGQGTGSGAAPAQVQARLADRVLRGRCESALAARYVTLRSQRPAAGRLEAELETIFQLGFASYFLAVAEVVDLIKEMGVRVAARGSGAGSLVNHLLGISGVEPMQHGLIMERFLSPLRHALPDIDIDVESARRTEIYQRVLERFGGERCVCVSMMETYRVRHAVRDVGAALGLPPGEVDEFAKAFPHIRARDARAALADLPELRRSGLGRLATTGRLDGYLDLVEGLDGLPRHIALHPCGVLLSDGSLLDRTPVEASWMGFPMSQFDKDAVEEMGFLKLDILGIRMQSAMQHAVAEIARVEGDQVELDTLPQDDPATFDMIRTTHTLGCFQIESPGQRELIGKFAPESFADLIIDISLFRPGPVKSDMITPFLKARQGWAQAEYLHPDLRQALAETHGVVVFHEQVIKIISVISGCSLAEADEHRRTLGSPEGQASVRGWFYPTALKRGYDLPTVEAVWEVLRAFASFGFCKAHAAAFALPTYQSAWLKAHHPAAFLAGVLTHDPGMYPKRLILDDARNLGISILGIDVNRSRATYQVEPCPNPQLRPREPGLPDGSKHGIRLPLCEVRGISAAEVERIVAGQPYTSLSDFWNRAAVATPVVEGLVLTGGFDGIYGIDLQASVRGRTTRRDLLLQAADLERMRRSEVRARGRGRIPTPRTPVTAEQLRQLPAAGSRIVLDRDRVGAVNSATRWGAPAGNGGGIRGLGAGPGDPEGNTNMADTVRAAAGQSQAPAAVKPAAVQLALDLDAALPAVISGLPEMSRGEAVRAELDLLGLDVSHHVIDFYAPMLTELGAAPSRDLLGRRSGSEVLVAGVKAATQTPPIRNGHRVVFLTLDDSTGPIDATFFEAAQEYYADTVFSSWLLLVRGEIRRTGPRGISIQGTGCWDLGEVRGIWTGGGALAVAEYLAGFPRIDTRRRAPNPAAAGAATGAPADEREGEPGSSAGGSETGGSETGGNSTGGMGQRRRVLLHASGFKQSPYADVQPPGPDQSAVPRSGQAAKAPVKLWHASPGSAGW